MYFKVMNCAVEVKVQNLSLSGESREWNVLPRFHEYTFVSF